MEDKTLMNSRTDSTLEEPYRSLKHDFQLLQAEVEELRAREARLNQELEKLRAREAELKEEVIRSQNRAEMIEGYNELMIEMLSKRKEWLLVIDMNTKEILYCNKKKQEGLVASEVCTACKKRLPFHGEILKWNSEEQYKVWEMTGRPTPITGSLHFRSSGRSMTPTYTSSLISQMRSAPPIL